MYYTRVLQLESCGFENICKPQHDMDARKFGVCCDSGGEQVYRGGGWIESLEEVWNYSSHDTYRDIFPDCFWSFGRARKLPSEDNTSSTAGQVKKVHFNYHIVCTHNEIKMNEYSFSIKKRLHNIQYKYIKII